MRTLLILAVALAAGAAVWLLVAPAEEGTMTTSDGERAPRRGDEVAPGDAAVRTEVPSVVPPAGSLGSGNAPSAPPMPGERPEPPPGSSAEPAPRVPYVPPEPPERLPKGRLRVTPRGPDDAVYASDGVRVTVEAVAGTYWTMPTGMPDAATGVWTFDKLPAGRVRLTLAGDHVVETKLDVDVVADRDTNVVLRAPPAGALSYRVLLGNGDEMPPQVSLALLRGDKPVKATWQVRTGRALTSPRTAPRVMQGPEGIVFGVKPGKYQLEVVGPGGTKRVVDVEIAAGRTATLDVRLPS